MSATHTMVANLDRLLAEMNMTPEMLTRPDIREAVEKMLLTEYTAAVTMAINLKLALLK